MSLLNDHFSPELNKRSERAKFHRLYQQNGENMKEFSIRLQKSAQTWEFDDFFVKSSDEQLIDQLVYMPKRRVKY